MGKTRFLPYLSVEQRFIICKQPFFYISNYIYKKYITTTNCLTPNCFIYNRGSLIFSLLLYNLTAD